MLIFIKSAEKIYIRDDEDAIIIKNNDDKYQLIYATGRQYCTHVRLYVRVCVRKN